MDKHPALIIFDDDESFVNGLSETLFDLGYEVYVTDQRRDVVRLLIEKKALIVLLGMNQSKESALRDLKWIKTQFPYVEIIVFSQRGHFGIAFNTMNLNAYDFLIKSPNFDEFIPIIDQAYQQASSNSKGKTFKPSPVLLKNEPPQEERETHSDENQCCMIGQSAEIKKIFNLISQVSPTNSSVLITGETGSGKELAAQSIHRQSPRSNKPFISINCGAIPETLLENELFGHSKGAFTDSVQLKHGLLEEASGGTLFLDEISELNLPLQVKLLRVLETGSFRRLGDTKEHHVDFRLISATNRNLSEEIKNRKFRSDLYYRLAVIPIHILPLRKRRDDIPLLVEHFLEYYNLFNSVAKKISASAMRILMEYEWPGNVREVKNVVERLAVLGPNKVIVPSDVINVLPMSNSPEVMDQIVNQQHYSFLSNDLISLEESEKRHIQNILNKMDGNLEKASEILKISVQQLNDKINQYSLGD